ncbi:terminase small subunit [Stenotrophomonas phage vB_SmeS_BUCT700]|uniref:Terminase small subunit n=1 Tax=Stenotrophomonas phage vB_SmeS_BUCT700 TaxID=2924895 RepID=A0AAE9K685_9CAUD|nr:terminase small subunit [Stenotrophomonas phage vB_SmeS_BUCT700]
MAKTSAAESALGELHTTLAQVMSIQLKNADLCTPALLNAVRGFLKDNEITCRVDESNALGELERDLANATAPNALPAAASDADNEAALAEVLQMSKYRGVG